MNRFYSREGSLEVRQLTIEETDTMGHGASMATREGLIHTWSAQYSTLNQYYPILSALVSPEELQKAAGFKKPVDRRRYILRHGLVRAILGHYTQEDPVKLSFIYGRSGKPDMDPEGKFSDIRFSLSCTDEMVCVGITRKSALGLDIVRTQPSYSFSAIEHYLFRSGERQWIAQAVPDRRPLRFFRIWSLKEALLKATDSDVRIMREADVSAIMADPFLDGIYSVTIGGVDQMFFIHESGCGVGHHCALVSLSKTT
jgi:phosphopantetheinyl transferase